MPPLRRRSKKELPATLRDKHLTRLFAMDEARVGLKIQHRRRWCPLGQRPPWTHADRYEWLWLYAAVEPLSGECLVLYLPHTDRACFQAFLQALRQAVPGQRLGLVMDGSGGHTCHKIRWPKDIEPIRLPPYSPELNPAERWFQEVRKALANKVFETLSALEDALTETLRPFWETPETLMTLTAYPWWRDAIASIPTS